MPIDFAQPAHFSYVYIGSGGTTVHTQQSIYGNGDITLFSTIVPVAGATYHCWTKGRCYGDRYLLQSEDSFEQLPGCITRSTTVLPHPYTWPHFTIPYPDPSTYLPSERGQYGSSTVPLPPVDPTPNPITPTPAPSPIITPAVQHPLKRSRRHTPRPRSTPTSRSNTLFGNGSACEKAMQSLAEIHGASGTYNWGSFSLDRGPSPSNQHPGEH